MIFLENRLNKKFLTHFSVNLSNSFSEIIRKNVDNVFHYFGPISITHAQKQLYDYFRCKI